MDSELGQVLTNKWYFLGQKNSGISKAKNHCTHFAALEPGLWSKDKE